MRNLPNLLTGLRIALTPFIFFAIAGRRFGQALVLILIAGVSDGLDGFLARKLHAESRFGAYVDPIGDKLLLTLSYLALGMAGAVPWWLVILIFARDLLILLMAGLALAFTKRRDFPPSEWGKLSTFCQIGAAVIVLVSGTFPTWGLYVDPCLWIAAAATVWSGIMYAVTAARVLRT